MYVVSEKIRCYAFAILNDCYQKTFAREDVIRKLNKSGSHTQITVNTIYGEQVHSLKTANDFEIERTNESVKD